MIKDVMVHLEGTAADEPRLATAKRIADLFEGHVIGLFLNLIPMALPSEDGSASAIVSAELVAKAREVGDAVEASLSRRLLRLNGPVAVRRFDVFDDVVGEVAAREARSADTFIAHTLARSGRARHLQEVVESVLFGSGRHLFLVVDDRATAPQFAHVLVAWNGSRESSRALGEAMPYLLQARRVTVLVVGKEPPVEEEALLGSDAVEHLRHHGIEAELDHVCSDQAAEALIREPRRREADLIVMGGYGHSRMREWLLGGATYELLRRAPVPLVIAH
jgi:nucleotide-binding universal stress UspA family protein